MTTDEILAEDPNTAAVVKVGDDSISATAGADTISGDDTIRFGDAVDHEALGLEADDPAVTGLPRDELHDSIDRVTGTLTEEAQALRAERAKATDEPVAE